MNESGSEVARLRQERGLTQEALGKLTGTTEKYIDALEHN